MKYIKGLDTLRAFAVLFVIIYHWGLPIKTRHGVYDVIINILPDGRFGVDLFFVLSGFLITSILLAALMNPQTPKITIIKNFIIRRSLRIFPVYYLLIMILVLIRFPFISEHLIWFLTYTSNILEYKTESWNPFSHTWSLAVEEQFYLLWPWCMVYIPLKFVKLVLMMAIAIGMVSTLYVIKIKHNDFGLLLMPSCMQAFGLGGLYAYCSKYLIGDKRLIRIMHILLPLAVIIHYYWAFSKGGGHFNYWYRTVNSLIAVWLVDKVICLKNGWVKKYVVENQILVKIGQWSYGIYLFHYILPWIYDVATKKYFDRFTFWKDVLHNFYCAYYLQLILLFSIACISFYGFEKPVMRLKTRFAYR